MKNIKTDLDITNGACGEIVDIVLDPHEPKHDDDRPVTHLKYLPLYILVKMKRTRAQKLAGLDKNVIPIEPTSQKIYLKIQWGKKIVSHTLIRKQFSMTSAYAFTDYCSQGQTIPYVLIDIGKPPTGKLNLFNLYVTLSRSSGQRTIQLLRDFQPEALLMGHEPEVMAEDDRLEGLNSRTKRWWDKMKEGSVSR
ncbi:hypothetical protein D9758_018101 [Tetrapyrgos nigripes]|uniref:Uncharacterized protein n=1 Tax=Tetrapyrgos nigripes TaxID=182062 RepID=A0A8H5BHH6_9AGAR|nr:hypothetical protein D9758_018101 [Tetrapyrgos nigripes]